MDPDPDLFQSEKSDQDPCQHEKQDPDLYQNGLNPQHWYVLLQICTGCGSLNFQEDL
jgi:hypothetical protein